MAERPREKWPLTKHLASASPTPSAISTPAESLLGLLGIEPDDEVVPVDAAAHVAAEEKGEAA
jgi:hypothetical protein